MAVYLGNKLAGFNNIINQSNIVVNPLNITAEGTYTAPNGTAYSPITVTVGDKLKTSVIRPDAEFIQSYSGTYFAVADQSMTITQPYDTTSRTPLAAGAHLTTNANNSIAINFTDYDYLVLVRCITIPIYSVTTVGKGREEYQILSTIYQFTNLPTIGLKALINDTTYNSNSSTGPSATCTRSLVWSSNSELTLYTGTTYGVVQVPAAPTITDNKLIIKSPSILIRGNTTYFTSTYYNALTDVQAKYKIDVYRSPKANLNTDGWGTLDEMTKIINCVKNNNMTLV